MGKAKRLLSNTAILGVGTFASKLLVFLMMPLYTSVLSSTQFGVADILTQTANLLIPFACIGICDAIFRFVLDTGDEYGDDRKKIFSCGAAVLAIGSVLIAALVQILRVFDIFHGYVGLVAAYVIFANLHSAAANFVRAEGKNVLFVSQGIANTALTVILNIVFLVVFDMGTLGYVLSVVVADAAMTVFLVFAAKLYKYFSFRHIKKETVVSMLRFSIPYIPTTVMWLITSASDRYIVVAYGSAAENGLYAAAYKLPTLLLLVCGVFIEAWQFSIVKEDGEGREKFFSDVFKNYAGIIFIGASVLIAGAKIATGLLMAPSYYESWRYVPILVLAMTFSALVSFFGSVYFFEKKSVMSMLTAMSGAIINIVLNFVLIPKHGAIGAAVATFISYFAVFVIRAYDTKFYVKFNMHTVRVAINGAVLLIQAIIMVSQISYWKYIQLACVAFILIFNGREIMIAISQFIKNARKTKKIEKN